MKLYYYQIKITLISKDQGGGDPSNPPLAEKDKNAMGNKVILE